MQKIMYHVAGHKAFERIAKEGIRTQQGLARVYPNSPDGVYLWNNWQSAYRWADMHLEDHNEPQDIYLVDATGLEMKMDMVYHNEDPEHPTAQDAWVYQGSLEEDRILHVEPHSWSHAAEEPDHIKPSLSGLDQNEIEKAAKRQIDTHSIDL